MSAELPSAVQQIERHDLLDPVRRQQHSPDFEIDEWQVAPIGRGKVMVTTGGLFHFSGQGHDQTNTCEWSLVLKILNKPGGDCLEPDEWCYWKREMLAFDSDLLASLPQGFKAPQSYGTKEHEDSAWVWMEYLVEAAARTWSLEHYQWAAHSAGRSAAAYLTGHPMPDYPWFPAFFRSAGRKGGFWASTLDPKNPESVWHDPFVQQHFGDPLRSKILSIWTDLDHFCNIQDRLPQVLCHNDFHRRNLMWCHNSQGQEELIALDWAYVGLGALASDIGFLVASSMFFIELDPNDAEALEAAVMEGYLAGLAEAGWQGDSRLLRLGYLLSANLWTGARLPTSTWWMQQDAFDEVAVFGYPAEQLVRKWVTLTEFLMTRADEARDLIGTLGLS